MIELSTKKGSKVVQECSNNSASSIMISPIGKAKAFKEYSKDVSVCDIRTNEKKKEESPIKRWLKQSK